MKFFILFSLFVIFTSFYSADNNSFKEDQSKLLYKKYADRIGQIEVVEEVSRKRSSLGSGFQINSKGYIVTNYHVISDAVLHPDRFHLEIINYDESKDTLSILGFDVINDIAILKNKKASKKFLKMNETALEKGTKLYSLGNPQDLGMSIIEGTYNGLLEDRRIENIFFSGSLNPGMSGGPTINKSGKVVGINVSKSGEQLSFLVPVKYLKELIDKVESEGIFDENQYFTIIEEQLYLYQNEYMNFLLNLEWERELFGEALILKKLADFLKIGGILNWIRKLCMIIHIAVAERRIMFMCHPILIQVVFRLGLNG